MGRGEVKLNFRDFLMWNEVNVVEEGTTEVNTYIRSRHSQPRDDSRSLSKLCGGERASEVALEKVTGHHRLRGLVSLNCSTINYTFSGVTSQQ